MDGNPYQWFETKDQAMEFIDKLIKQAEDLLWDYEGHYPSWAEEIYLFQLIAEVQHVPYDGSLKLYNLTEQE